MIYSVRAETGFFDQEVPFWRLTCGLLIILFAQLAILAQVSQVSLVDEHTMIVEDAPDMDVVAIGKSVIIRTRAKSVLAVGGNLLIEGHVEGDVGVLGGTLTQKENAFIGGDIIVFGGSYRPEGANPLRAEEKQTVIVGMFEDEIRNMAANPSQILAPDFSLTFLAQRILSVLFWFVVSLGLTTIAPGAVSRAITRFQLSTSKVVALGFLAFLITTILIFVGLKFLPSYINAIFVLMAFVLLMLAYVFGRVTLQVSVGKMLQKYFLSEKNRSETLAILIGGVVWTAVLSLPYIWMFGVLALFSAGIGLVLTARQANGWQKN